MEKMQQKFFLGANSAEGFVSHFADSYEAGSWRAYIIKGGPGTGKSSFMKYLAAKAGDKGYKTVLCPCSSDPDSLDGIIIEELKTVVLDGTAPHVVEPVLPGACENIINLGEFWKSEELFSKAQGIKEAAGRNTRFHKTAAAYICAAGEVLYDNLKLARIFTNRTAVLRFAKRLSDKYLPAKAEKGGIETVRFISGITPKGIICFSGTVTDHYKNIVVIDDKTGSAAGEIMKYLGLAAKEKGYGIIALKNPILPSELTDHILIPELSLAFVTENAFAGFDVPVRRVHSRRFINKAAAKKYRARMRFNNKVSNQLLFGAVETLKLAKESHDTLEKFYIDSMDFKALTEFAVKAEKAIIPDKKV